jgi:hypothetical protein
LFCQKQGAANGTIDRELGVSGRTLRFAHENGKLHRIVSPDDLHAVARRFEESDKLGIRTLTRRRETSRMRVVWCFGQRPKTPTVRKVRAHFGHSGGHSGKIPSTN